MGRLLDEFASALPKLQARQLQAALTNPNLRLVTTRDFREAFQNKLRELLESDVEIRMEFKELLVDDIRSSELVNHMFNLLVDDLMSLSAEIDLVADAQATQEILFRQEIAERLALAVEQAETEVRRLEFLRGHASGLNDAIVENFKSGSNRLSREAVSAPLAYADPKLFRSIPPDYEMPVERGFGGLVLPMDRTTTTRAVDIRDILNEDSLEGENFGLPNGSLPSTPGRMIFNGNPQRAIDGQPNTFWKKTLHTETPVAGGARWHVSVNLGNLKEINFVEIQPFAEANQSLEQIYYYNELGEAQQIELIGGAISLNQTQRIFFREVTTRRLNFIFSQKTYTTDSDSGKAVYSFGLDNVFTGRLTYKPHGYYVSRELSSPQIKLLSLTATENDSLGLNLGDDLSPIADPLPTIEYWVAFREYDDNDSLVVSAYLPILPAGATNVTERVFQQENDIALTSFKLDETPIPVNPGIGLGLTFTDLELYRDGVLILRDTDYTIVEGEEVVEPTQLLIDREFGNDHEYIAVYTPLHLVADSVPIPFEDRTGMFRYNPDNTIQVNRAPFSRAVRSEANLIIVMRATGNHRKTSVVNQFVFGVCG